MKIIVTGANGQLAQQLLALPTLEQIDWIGLTREQCDITNVDELHASIQQSEPDWIINTAAYTAVDKAESEPELAYQINTQGAENLAIVAKEYDIPLFHISTDYVFSGDQQIPYKEIDTCQPNNIYGKSKLAGEHAIQQHCERYIILRTAWVYGNYGNNFFKTLLNLARQKSELTIVADQQGSPTATIDIAQTIVTIIQAQVDKWGLYHFTNSGQTNWYEFAKMFITRDSKINHYQMPKIVPISTADYPTAAKRPQFSVLNCDKITQDFNIKLRSWQDALNDVYGQR